MKFAQEIQLLKDLAAGEGQQVARRFLSRAVDIERLESFLYEQHLDLYFLDLAERQRLLNLLPRSMREQLSWLRDDQRRRNQRLLDALTQIQSLLDSESIDLLVLKGLPLAECYWGGTDRRFCWDLDLLIHERDRTRSLNTLCSIGYRNPSPAFMPDALTRRLTHAVELSGGDVPVDLHWRFRQRPGYTIDYDAVWARSRQWQGEAFRCRIPAAEDDLKLMLLGIAQDVERGHCRHRKLWDIYLWLRREQDFEWEAFVRTCSSEGVEHICLNMLALTVLALDCAGEFPALDKLLQSRAGEILCTTPVVERLLSSSRQHPGNRLWFARLQAVPAWFYLAWWTLTAPMRYLLGRSI